MEERRMTIQEVADIVDMEGLGYAISGYMSGVDIEDDTLRELWMEAYDILSEIERILAPFSP